MAKDEEYEVAIKKGSQLLEMLPSSNNTTTQHQAPPPKTTQSKFTAVEDLSKYGYTDELTTWKSGKSILKRLALAFQALDVNAEMVVDGGNNVLVEHQHLEDRTIHEVYYPATLATFVQFCNPIDGVLIAYNNTTAAHSGRLQEPPILNLLPLQHWSDVTYLQWLSASSFQTAIQAPAPITNLPTHCVSDDAQSPVAGPAHIKHIFRLSIQNVPTYSILNKIVTKHKRDTYDIWPGLTFPIDSEEGKAILGTPNGAGIAWLLAQHKKELESRSIEKVTVFYAENESDMCRWPSLCFWLN